MYDARTMYWNLSAAEKGTSTTDHLLYTLMKACPQTWPILKGLLTNAGDPLKYIVEGAWRNSPQLWRLISTLHSMRLASAGLAIGKDGTYIQKDVISTPTAIIF